MHDARMKFTYRLAFIFWILAVVAIPIWSHFAEPVIGWDLNVYRNAVHAMSLGHDPYLDGIAVQRVFHSTFSQHPDAIPPYTYVYSPTTLPLLRALGSLPPLLTGSLYWLLIVTGILAAIFVGFWCASPSERTFFILLTPLAIFFPGLLLFDVVFSGNVAFILYGLVLIAALWGWGANRWSLFYVAVLATSCCKAPMLSLLAIPVLSARRQWIPAFLTGAGGVFAFAIQPYIWPRLFQHYLEAVELQFSFNKDFGISPAGVLARALFDYIPYQKTSAVFYGFYTLIVAAILLFLSRKFFFGSIQQKDWIPVMMLGVILLNPRIMEYDIAPITLMMALLVWRIFAHLKSVVLMLLSAALFASVTNFFATKAWRTTECFILVSLFLAGSLDLYLKARNKHANDVHNEPAMA